MIYTFVDLSGCYENMLQLYTFVKFLQAITILCFFSFYKAVIYLML